MAMAAMVPAEVPPYWQVYFTVADLDAAIEQTKGAGVARSWRGRWRSRSGRVAVVTDPQGAAFSLMRARTIPSRR